jgi:hypothetical protein
MNYKLAILNRGCQACISSEANRRNSKMSSKLQIREGILPRLREIHRLPSEEAQARLMGVSLSSIRRIDAGDKPSVDFIAALCTTFRLGIGEAFEIISDAEQLAA